MSIRPFTASDITQLIEIYEKNGWHIKGQIQETFLYSLKTTNLIIFTLRFPLIHPKIRINAPYEIANFKISIAFKLWHLNNKTLRIIIYFIKALKELAKQVFLEPNISLEGNLQEFLNFLNKILPEIIKNESERSWLNRIRTSIMNKREQFSEQFTLFDKEKTSEVVKILKDSGLSPTFKQPWELKKGVPKIRTSETLLFSNQEELSGEFFIFERGYITYFKDLNYNKFYVRTFFESYSPYVLYTILNFKRDSDFKFETHVKNWIRLSRIFLNSIIEIINNANLNSSEFISFNPEYEFLKDDFVEDQCNFPFSALNYESSLSKELFSMHNNLFESPPAHFELLESTMEYYTKAESFIRNYQFEPATRLLNEALKIFNRYRQKKAIISVLLLLRKIAFLLNDKELEQNYLENALNIIKNEKLSGDYLTEIHYKLGKVYYKLKLLNEAVNHFNIVITLNKNKYPVSNPNDITEEIKKKLIKIGMSYLYLGLISLEQEKPGEAKKDFKSAFEIGKITLKVRLKFYLSRGLVYKERNNISQAIKLLTLGLNLFDEENHSIYHNLYLQYLLELADIYIYFRKNKNKSSHYLQLGEEHMDTKTISGILYAMRWNVLMSNYFKFIMKDHENYEYYSKQSQDLISHLQKIGVKDVEKSS